jgi:diacylglycerol kinase family enzyme
MLHRADKVKVPIGYIPNGSGNDTCRSLNSNEVGIALDYIVKGNIFKTDIIKVISDYENEAEIPDDKKDINLRYCLINSVFGVTAKIVHRAISCKGCCCNPY